MCSAMLLTLLDRRPMSSVESLWPVPEFSVCLEELHRTSVPRRPAVLTSFSSSGSAPEHPRESGDRETLVETVDWPYSTDSACSSSLLSRFAPKLTRIKGQYAKGARESASEHVR